MDKKNNGTEMNFETIANICYKERDKGNKLISVSIVVVDKNSKEIRVYNSHESYTSEVDLEKEFDKCCENYIFDDECEIYTAKRFFELGIKAMKGE